MTHNPRYTPDCARQLAFIRQVLLRAERDADVAEPLCNQALLGIHDAAELFLVLAANSISATVKSNMDFLAYWEPINAALAPQELKHKGSMTAVNRAPEICSSIPVFGCRAPRSSVLHV